MNRSKILEKKIVITRKFYESSATGLDTIVEEVSSSKSKDSTKS